MAKERSTASPTCDVPPPCVPPPPIAAQAPKVVWATDEVARLESYDLRFRVPWRLTSLDPLTAATVDPLRFRSPLTHDALERVLGLSLGQRDAIGVLWEERSSQLWRCEAEFKARRNAIEHVYDPAIRQLLTPEQQQRYDDPRQNGANGRISLTATYTVGDVVLNEPSRGGTDSLPTTAEVEIERDGKWMVAQIVATERASTGILWMRVRELDATEEWRTLDEFRPRR